MIQIDRKVIGMIATNVYLLINEETRECILVDPADDAPVLISWIEGKQLSLKAIFLTHGHQDHILAAKELAEHFSVRIYAGEKERFCLGNSAINMSIGSGRAVSITDFEAVEEGQILEFLGEQIRVIETPGHTAGSICFYMENEGKAILIAGDTLFSESFGRTDLTSGSMEAIIHSIMDKLFLLPDDTRVYPGHGEYTTIGYEKNYNPIRYY